MTQRYKYNRTYHFSWSPGAQNDDRILCNDNIFVGKEVIVTEKMDGENSNLYRDYIHARSLDSQHHNSRNWVKNLHNQIAHLIPMGWRICGENLYAKHAIHYQRLPTFFMAFSVWDDDNMALSWADTEQFCKDLTLDTVPVLYKGVWDENLIKNLYTPIKENGDEMEGFVVRLADKFHYDDFPFSVGKYVRKGHVEKTTGFWRNRPIIPNKLIEEN